MIYKDLEREIEIIEMRIQDLTNEKAKLEYMMEEHPNLVANYGGERVQTSPKQLAYRDIAGRIEEIKRLIDENIELKREKLQAKHEIDKHLQGLEGLGYKVAYMKDIQGKNLQEISIELNYSYGYIKRINSCRKQITLK